MAALTDTPVVAVANGFMRHDVGGAGGNGAWLTGVDGFSYYYAHFSHYEGADRLVVAGDVIGYVGMTGNAHGPASALRDPPRQARREACRSIRSRRCSRLCNENLPKVQASNVVAVRPDGATG